MSIIRCVFGCLMLLVTLDFTSSAVASNELYDEFAHPSINHNRWKQPSSFALNTAGKLRFLCGSVGAQQGVSDASLVSLDVGASYQAKLSIKSINLSGADSTFVRMAGVQYLSLESPIPTISLSVWAAIYFGDRGNGLEAWWRIAETIGNDIDSVVNETTGTIVAPGVLELDNEYDAELTYNGGNSLTFKFNGMSTTQSGPVFISPAPLSGLEVQCGQSYVSAESGLGEGEISAEIDDFTIDGVLHDDFSSALLDSSKWNTSNYARYIDDGKASFLVNADDNTEQGDMIRHQLSVNTELADTDYMRATLVLKSDSQISDNGTAGISMGGVWFNDTFSEPSDANGEQGNIRAEITLEKNNGNYRVYTRVYKSNNADFSDVTELDFYVFNMPIYSDVEYNVEIQIVYSEFISFTLNEFRYLYQFPDSVYSLPPGFTYKNFTTQIQDQPGSIQATIDHVCVDDPDDLLVGYPCPTGLPGKHRLVKPLGSSPSNPTFSWKGSYDASFYYLQVIDSGNNQVFQQWLSAVDVCDTRYNEFFGCDYTPSSLGLSLGDEAYWSITGWNHQFGIGLQSDLNKFTVTCVNPPLQMPTISSPNVVNELWPMYAWLHQNDAERYILNVYSNTDNGRYRQGGVFSIDPDSTSCLDDNICESRLLYGSGLVLGGEYTLYAAAQNACGNSPIAQLDFTRECNSPPTRELYQWEPSGYINTDTPTYRWSRDYAADNYFLYVIDVEGNIIEQRWIHHLDACNYSDCETDATNALPHGWSSWYITSKNSCGFSGLWSGKAFFRR